MRSWSKQESGLGPLTEAGNRDSSASARHGALAGRLQRVRRTRRGGIGRLLLRLLRRSCCLCGSRRRLRGGRGLGGRRLGGSGLGCGSGGASSEEALEDIALLAVVGDPAP